MGDRRSVDNLTLEELERLVLLRRRQERRKRLRQKSPTAQPQEVDLPPEPPADVERHDELSFLERATSWRTPTTSEQKTSTSSWRDRLLLLVEIVALGGLIVAVLLWAGDRPGLVVGESASGAPPLAEVKAPTVLPAASNDAAAAQPEVLPGRPPPPPEATGAALPALYADWLDTSRQETAAVVPNEAEARQRPVRIVIPSIDVDAPIVPGDDWEALKKGVGHHLGSSLPGERGNVVLSAHNDIFGEIFRYLHKVEKGDEIIVYDGAGRKYRYVVAVERIVEPTAVEVLEQTNEPVTTLITCHPYLVDTERLVVVAELQQ